jgi:valyl-tRNA synthetase
MASNLSATYDHHRYESSRWTFWRQGGWFHAKLDSKALPYSILIPPPNVTSRLHMGHGLNNTIQDILIRWKRMQGYNCCWLPGTDHAGIATQMMVEQALASEGSSRQELGREAFFQRCVDWKEENGDLIITQQQKLGASYDVQRLSYTMDAPRSRAVRKIFVDLYNDGLIYRGERLVNWDPALSTAISDDEVESRDINGSLWYVRYQVEGDASSVLTVATSRPETLLGDTAIAVHPDDERYQHLLGKNAIIPIAGRLIPIIADSHVDPAFGTGCVKVTPAHDPNDFAIGKRHQLPAINIFTEDGHLNENCPGHLVGLERFVGRAKICEELAANDALEKVESIKHAVPFSQRSNVPIEPRLSLQWFVRMEPLAQPAIAAAKNSELNFYPPQWKKTYLHWLENIQDWCISRQLWWGHRLPIWYCQSCNTANTGMEDPTQCSSCGSSELRQDEDVLDTWFSSWLWPVSTLGWPDDTKDLAKFFPSQVLVTAPDIIYLWVARMVMLSYYTKQELPFKEVYFNALICDKLGRKFSKTLGNGIDPLKLIELYGADAVRFTCVSMAPLGGRVKMAEEDFLNGSRFINKIWNAARFLLNYTAAYTTMPAFVEAELDVPSRWLLHSFRETSAAINRLLERYQINEAVEQIYQLIWRTYCDWGLEAAKLTLEGDDQAAKERTLSVLVYVFEGILRLASPVIPFVCEELWHELPAHPQWSRPESLVIAAYPDPARLPAFPEAHQQWGRVQDMVSAIRSLRSQAKIPPKVLLTPSILVASELVAMVRTQTPWLTALAGLEKVEVGDQLEKPAQSLLATGAGWTVYLPVGEYLDLEKERARLRNEVQRVEKIISGLEAKLANENFVARAPEEVIEQVNTQLANMRGQLDSLQLNLRSLAS